MAGGGRTPRPAINSPISPFARIARAPTAGTPSVAAHRQHADDAQSRIRSPALNNHRLAGSPTDSVAVEAVSTPIAFMQPAAAPCGADAMAWTVVTEHHDSALLAGNHRILGATGSRRGSARERLRSHKSASFDRRRKVRLEAVA